MLEDEEQNHRSSASTPQHYEYQSCPIGKFRGQNYFAGNSMSKAGQHYEYATHNLWDLCYRGDLKAATMALRRGIDVNVRNKIGWTPLHAAASGGQAKVLEFLLENGADLDATDNVSALCYIYAQIS
eukprot:scaffold269415_cov32-Prasinocladus_malaysianus.AAC.1